MGRSLHNKIYLGRTRVMASKAKQAAFVVGGCVSIALAWLLLRA